MTRAIWSGAISFGLVNIPVKLLTATRDKEIRFHQLHGKDHVRLKSQMVCPAEDNKEVPREDMVKGFEIAPDQYVIVQGDELESLEPQRSRTVDILGFVDAALIDPIYYDRPYYLVPDERAGKAYHLLVEAMTHAGKVGLAKFVMRQREYLAALRPIGKILCAEIMRYADEIIPAEELAAEAPAAKVAPAELKMAQQLIDSLAMPFEPKKYHDEYRDRIESMIEAKAAGHEVVTPPPAQESPKVIDLMKALEESLAQAKKKPHKRTA